MPGAFSTTNWSLVVAAGKRDATSRAALEELCGLYWFPLFAFVRRRSGSADAALDLTQGFFAELLERNPLDRVDPSAGRFRSFLLASVKNYLSHERERSSAQKRGGGKAPIPLDADAAEERFAIDPGHERTPEKLFEYHWAMTVLERVADRLAAEFAEAGKQREHRALAPFLTGGGRGYREIAEELATTEGAIKMAVRRMRQRYGVLLREQVAQSVADPAEVDAELRHLLAVVRDG